ncbi:MAG TPA: DUF1801 domain-containing protein [Pseudolysinimonas sp.]|nr:DUF1801 domain-containing protein [Pseudolysinimonas sp.]
MAPATVDEYLETFPDDAQAILRRIRDLIRTAEPAVQEQIKYGMPAMILEGRHAIYFAGWAKHVAIYPVHEAPEPLESDLAPYRSDKDTVKFLYAKPIPWDVVERLLAFLATK